MKCILLNQFLWPHISDCRDSRCRGCCGVLCHPDSPFRDKAESSSQLSGTLSQLICQHRRSSRGLISPVRSQQLPSAKDSCPPSCYSLSQGAAHIRWGGEAGVNGLTLLPHCRQIWRPIQLQSSLGDWLRSWFQLFFFYSTSFSTKSSFPHSFISSESTPHKMLASNF